MENKWLVFCLAFFTLFLKLSFAQSFQEILTPEIASVIVIGIFVTIIIIMIWERKKGVSFPVGMIIFILIIILLFVLPIFIKYPEYPIPPPEWQVIPFPFYVKIFFTTLGLPEEWLAMPAFLYYFLIPFIAIWIIVYAFLKQIRIFGEETKWYRVLSFLIALSTIPLGFFIKIVGLIFGLIGAWSIALFATVFVIGAFLISYRATSIQYYALKAVKSAEEELKKAYQRLEEVNRAIVQAEKAQDKELLQKLLMEKEAIKRTIRSLGGVVVD
jgi:glucan phosphoethanolaminetransferase (alkaline phosphatase superfamily)